jgi:hypothetical protein
MFAYRIWRYQKELCAFVQGNPWVPEGTGYVRANCLMPKLLDRVSIHAVPGENCRCGFYGVFAVKTLFNVAVPTPSILNYVGNQVVFGIVELAGRIVVHQKGARAELARPTVLVMRSDLELYDTKTLGDAMIIRVKSTEFNTSAVARILEQWGREFMITEPDESSE